MQILLSSASPLSPFSPKSNFAYLMTHRTCLCSTEPTFLHDAQALWHFSPSTPLHPPSPLSLSLSLNLHFYLTLSFSCICLFLWFYPYLLSNITARSLKLIGCIKDTIRIKWVWFTALTWGGEWSGFVHKRSCDLRPTVQLVFMSWAFESILFTQGWALCAPGREMQTLILKSVGL